MLKESHTKTFYDKWINSPENSDNISHVHITKAFSGNFEDYPSFLNPNLIKLLQNLGISKLYSHQAQAINEVNQGNNIVVTTGPSSGKSLIFIIPMLNHLFNSNPANTLLLFPTKALAYDQYNHINKFLEFGSKEPFKSNKLINKINVYDGDTPIEKRSIIRKNSQIILTNPDMLHLGILPNHMLWEKYFENLQYIVLDEAHYYRGIFGSHIANVLRRLKRILTLYNQKPVFICTSATIGNPLEFLNSLVEEEFSHIHYDSSPKGRKLITFYNPPVINEDLGIRKSCQSVTLNIIQDFLHNNTPTLVFQGTRKEVEKSLKALSEIEGNKEFASYRSGYLAADRRNIEDKFRSGKIQVLFSTNALEMGIDIGGLKSVILTGYPGSIASTLQQIGRAGREQNESIAILVASSNPIDQYIIKRPEYLLLNNPEKALINPNNFNILLNHLKLSISEISFIEGEKFGNLDWDQIKLVINQLLENGNILKIGNKYISDKNNSNSLPFSLRNMSSITMKLINITKGKDLLIGDIDYASSLWMVHPQAIYFHLGDQFRVSEINFENHEVYLLENNSNYFTEPKIEKTYEVIEVFLERNFGYFQLNFGNIRITQKVSGYKEILWENRQVIGEYELDLPETILETEAFWFSLPDELINVLISEKKWLNHSNDYGPGWNEYSKNIRKRDNFTCQNCGAVERNSSFHVHHKRPIKLFSTIEEANIPSNLITLCPTCHRKAEIQVRVRSGMAGLAFLLNNLAPVFIMSSPGDLSVIIDSKNTITGIKNSIILYDNMAFGLGLSKEIFQNFDHILLEMYQHVKSCGCFQGCPSCVGPISDEGYGGKGETIRILELLTDLINGLK